MKHGILVYSLPVKPEIKFQESVDSCLILKAQIHSNSSTEMELIHGNSSAQVLEKYRKKNRWFVWPWHEDSANLSPFGEPCFGVVFAASDVEYYVHTTIRGLIEY